MSEGAPSSSTIPVPRRRGSAWLAAVVPLVLCLAVTWVTVHAVVQDARFDGQREFAFAGDEIQAKIEKRLAECALLLHGASGLFAASDEVTRAEFRAYVEKLRLANHQPGVVGIGFIRRVPKEALPEHLRAARADGFPDYAIHPAGEREVYAPILYLEPSSDGNLRAVGFDAWTEHTRREALVRTRDLNAPTLSGKVILVQASGTDIQVGTLLYMPVYRNGDLVGTVDERRAALMGWVFGSFRMRDLLEGILPQVADGNLRERLAFRLYDGDTIGAKGLLYESHQGTVFRDGGLERTTRVSFGGHQWTVRFGAPWGDGAWVDYSRAWYLGMFGVVISALLFGLFRALLRTRDRARELAAQVTADLRASEESYRRQFDENSAVMLLIDAEDGHLVDANRAAVRFYGHPREKLLAMRIWEINTIPVEKAREAMGQVIAGERSRFEFTHRLADGALREIEAFVSLIVFGQRKALHAIIVDITERKRAEAERAEMGKRLSLAMEVAGEGMWDWDVKAGVVKHNRRWCEILGLDDSYLEHPLDAFTSRLHDEDRPRVWAAIQAALSGTSPYRSKHRMFHADGSVRWVMDRGQVVERDADGKATHLVGSVADITDQHRAEDALREERRRLADIIHGTNVGTWEWNVRTGETFFNERWAEIIGYTLDELAPVSIETWMRLAHPDDLKTSGELLQRHFRGELPYYETECRMRHKNGHWVWVLDRGRLVSRTPDGEPLLMSGTHQDISARKRIEEDLRASNTYLEAATQEAHKANAAKSEFLARMSHEIRTPMNGVIGMLSLLLDSGLSESARKYAETAQASGRILLQLINDILDVSKIEAGKMELETVDFDLGALLDEVAGLLAVKAAEKGLELFLDLEPGMPRRLCGDQGRIRQILVNLVGNAIKFTEQGEIAVRAILVAMGESRMLLRLSVRDTGIGIPAEKTGLLFEKFQQVDTSNTRRFGGTGLGLAICKQLAGLMGGTVGVESREGKGSEFWVTLSLALQPTQPAPKVVPPGAADARILVVTGNATGQQILCDTLRAWGVRPVAADNPAIAMDLFFSGMEGDDPFRLLLIDRELPGMNGPSFVRMLRADARAKETAMVLLSSRLADDRRIADLSAGVTAIVSKPVLEGELFACLNAILSGETRLPAGLATAPVLPQGTRARVLLVEDNPTNQLVALGFLKRLGVHADAVGNGAEAIDALGRLPYDLVFMDVQMPVMDGLCASRQIRDASSQVLDHDVPIVAMTAHAMSGDRELCLAAGMNDYITKPIEVAALEAAIGRWLAGRRTQGTQAAGPGTGAEAPAGRHPVFDRAGLRQRLQGDGELMRLVRDSFLSDGAEVVTHLETALQGGSLPIIAAAAHTLKGASAAVGGEALRYAAADVEQAAREGDAAQAIAAGALIRPRFEELRWVLLDFKP